MVILSTVEDRELRTVLYLDHQAKLRQAIYLNVKILNMEIHVKVQHLFLKGGVTRMRKDMNSSAPDAVDRIVEQWKRERPDLDVSSMAIIARISLAERLIDDQMRKACSDFGLERWGFDVLVTLRRVGTPYQLSPTQLYSSLLRTSGAITNRIDRLEEAGFVKRLQDPNDRRGTLVSLTAKGLKTIEAAVDAHVAMEEEMVASLSITDRKTLATLLKRLLGDLEPRR
jgi:DNA-binding MarR family transcriptional regulator